MHPSTLNAAAWIQHRLQAKPGRYAIFAKDLGTGREIAYHADEVFPAASLIKVPIMMELFRHVEEKGLSLDRRRVLRVEDQVAGSGVLQFCTPGTRWKLRDLITLMIAISDNTATNLLIDQLGVAGVNRTLKRYGFLNTKLIRRLERLPQDRDSQFNHTSARDMALLMESIATGRAVSAKASQSMRGMLFTCQGPLLIAPPPPTPRLPDHPGQRVAHKTGSLSNARHDAGIVYLPNQVYVAAVLSEGAPEPTLRAALTPIAAKLRQLLRRAWS